MTKLLCISASNRHSISKSVKGTYFPLNPSITKNYKEEEFISYNSSKWILFKISTSVYMCDYI